MSTLNDAFVTVVPAIVIEPVTLVRAADRGVCLAEEVFLHAVARRSIPSRSSTCPRAGAAVVLARLRPTVVGRGGGRERELRGRVALDEVDVHERAADDEHEHDDDAADDPAQPRALLRSG